MKDVKVYAQNLRSYNIGLDQGRWITLGIEEQELQRILTEQLHLTKNHPDMAIFDYQADFEISEYEDIYELNQAVAQLKQLPEQDYEKVMDYCDARDITSPLEISNVCLQADEVPYERFPDWIDENVKDPEEKLGYALFENNSLAPEIKAAGMEGYFDYKAYGRDDKSFIQTSAYLADRLFDIMCDSVEIPSADLLCLSFQTNQEIYYALIKLNYQNSFMHELMKYDNEEIISNIRHKKILPLGKRISEGIIFNLSLQKVMLKEKKYEMLNGDKIYYLTERFLRSIAQTEAKRKYQILSRTIKTINKKYPEDGLEHQMDTKSKLCKIFEEDQEFSINKIGDELFGKNPQKKMEFDEKMERYNMQYDKFTVEKEETIKDLGYIKLQTNNEIEIKIPMEEYQTKECIKVEEEPDGTKTIVMKNIEQVTVE